MEEEKDNLINDSAKTSILNESIYNQENRCIKNNIFKRITKIPFIFLFFIFITISAIVLSIVYFVFFFTNNPNFNIYNVKWENFFLNDRDYEMYNFSNGLEIMLIHDKEFDMDGGAIVINKGYMNNPYEEGIASFVTLLLNYTFGKNDEALDNYYGNYDFDTEADYTNFRFDILNAGFKKYLGVFSTILEIDNNSKFFDEHNKYFEDIKNIMEDNYLNNKLYIENRENHLLEYLVYDLKNSSGDDILPEGNRETISKYNYSELKKKTINYINNLLNPENIKIVLFSKYKFIISSKYMIKYFQYLINKNYTKNQQKEKLEEKKFKHNSKFKKSQIFYIKANDDETNYIKIIYFIDKIKNESYNELFYKEDYFNYIIDILSETKEGSLYSLLNKNSDYNIKSLSSDFYIIFKSIIRFEIIIELNSLKNINNIIFTTYQYMHKIVKEAIGENIQINRYKELRDIFNQTLKNLEKSYDTMELAKYNGIRIFDYDKNKPEYYFYTYWCPWEIKMNDNENIEKIKEETNLYFSQLKPENSVIILAFRDNELNNITCNEDSPFPLNCSYFKNKDNINKTKYYDVIYINKTFNSSDFEEYLDINNTADISHVKNNYISIHKDIPDLMDEKEQDLIINRSLLTTFYFIKNMTIRTPKVYISLNLLHPYLRPLLNDKKQKNCYFFQILEVFSAIEKKIKEVLSDAIRAKNEIEFGYNENYLYINVLCYEDLVEKILTVIKNITFDTNWNLTDFITNNEIYKYETYDNFLNFDFDTNEEVGKYYFLCKVKNGLFNKYEFNKIKFENIYDEYCLNDIKQNINKFNKFIINGTMYGYFKDSEPEKILKIFERQNIEEEKKFFITLLKEVNNSVDLETFSFWNNEIKHLNESDIVNKIEIDRSLFDKYEKNISFIYISLSEDINFIKTNGSDFMKLSLIDNMFKNIYSYSIEYLINIDMFTYRDIYFELMIDYYYYNNYNLNNYSLDEKIFCKLLEQSENIYTKPVDNIGNRFYYLQKNLGLVLFKRQSSLKQKAIEEVNYRVYNYSILYLEKIIDEYNKREKNYDFNLLKEYFEGIKKNKKFEVNLFVSNKSEF